MDFWNLYFLNRIKPVWLKRCIANILGFLLIYPIVLYNTETSLMISIFLSAFVYKSIKNASQCDRNIDKNREFLIYQFISSLFCACIFVFDSWHIYVMQVCLGCLLLRIYDFYKPSLIGRFYKLQTNIVLGYILSSILQGILSGISVMMLNVIYLKFL